MEKTIFRSVVGDSPTTRILELLLEARELDYSLSDIARNSCVSWSTLHRVWDEFERNKIVKQTRMIGKAKMYLLNRDTPAVRKLIRFFDSVIKEKNEKHLQERNKRHVQKEYALAHS